MPQAKHSVDYVRKSSGYAPERLPQCHKGESTGSPWEKGPPPHFLSPATRGSMLTARTEIDEGYGSHFQHWILSNGTLGSPQVPPSQSSSINTNRTFWILLESSLHCSRILRGTKLIYLNRKTSRWPATQITGLAPVSYTYPNILVIAAFACDV